MIDPDEVVARAADLDRKVHELRLTLEDLDARVAAVENDRVIEILAAVVREACTVEGDEVDSLFLAAYADALRLLASVGRVEILQQRGTRVIARWIPREGHP